MQIVIVGIIVIGMLVTAAGAALGGRKAFDATTERNIGIYKVSSDEFDKADLNRIQKADRTGPLKAVGGIAEAALSAQSVATPGVAPNPIGLGLGEGITAGQLAAQVAEEVAAARAAADEATADDAAGASSAGAQPPDQGPAELREWGVDLSTAPDDYYVVWYVPWEGERRVFVASVGTFREDGMTSFASLFPESKDPSLIKKVPLTNAHPTEQEAAFAVDSSVTRWREDYGVLGGVEYNFGYYRHLFGT
jgi:hypothetical protein